MNSDKIFTYRTMLYVSIGLYLLCLPFGAVCTSRTHCHSGWGILLFGWITVLGDLFWTTNSIWIANLLLFMAWPSLIGSNGKWWDIGFSFFVFVIGASFLLVRTVV